MSASGNPGYFAPKAGRFGKVPIVLTGPCGTAATTTLTSSGTTTFTVASPYRKIRFEKAAFANVSLPGLSASGGAVATVFKVSSGTSTALTASLTLDAQTSGAVSPFTILTTLNPPDCILAEGDRFSVAVSLGTASVTTASTGGYWFSIEASVME